LRFVHVALLGFAVTSVACRAPEAKAAEPGNALVGTTDSSMLVPYEVKNDADMARAIREYYTKYEYRIPMRDGVRLHTAVYVPKPTIMATAPKAAQSRYGTMIYRTPYGCAPYGTDSYPTASEPYSLRKFQNQSAMIRAGYIFVQQDVRGRHMSEGAYVDIRPLSTSGTDESTDAYDTIEWLKNTVAESNGRFATWGISYPGFYAAMAAVNPHPALAAVSPQAPVTEWFLGDDVHHNGAFMLAQTFDFNASFGKPRPELVKTRAWGFDYKAADLYEFFLNLGPLSEADRVHFKGSIGFWNDAMKHETRDAFWKDRDPRASYTSSRRQGGPAIMTVGGWYDAEDLWGTFETYRAFERGSSKSDNTLVIGPWRHGGWGRSDGAAMGPISFGSKTAVFYRDEVEAAFFRRHLRTPGATASAQTMPEVVAFETGSNQWRSFASFPPPGVKTEALWFEGNGATFGAGTLTHTAPSNGVSKYVSDPNKPVPYTSQPSIEFNADYMVEDQRFAARRQDVLAFQTPVLAEDYVLAGEVEAELLVATTSTDADFVVKLIDVFPSDAKPSDVTSTAMTGYQQLVRGEILRAKFRNSFENPEALVPNQPLSVKLRLPSVFHAFRTGHRLMVQVQSTWFPLFDRNPQKFVNIRTATPTDFVPAEISLFTGKDVSGKTGTRLLLPHLLRSTPALATKTR
jgi:uncharacterized protein